MSTSSSVKRDERPTVHTAAYLRPGQVEALKALAEAQERSVGSLIRIAVDRFIAAGAGQ